MPLTLSRNLPDNFEDQLSHYCNHIMTDYCNWQKNTCNINDPISIKVRDEMNAKFCNSVRVERGSKYLKIVAGGSAHSFVVLKADVKFKVGDILKAATFKAPATNFSRGNMLTGDFSRVTWTGAI